MKRFLVWHLTATPAIGVSADQVRRTFQGRGYDVRQVEEVAEDERPIVHVPRSFLHGMERSV